MNPTPKRRTMTYIVRIWAEYQDEQPPRWCGVIEVAGSGLKTYFSQLDEMNDFIKQQTTLHHNTK